MSATNLGVADDTINEQNQVPSFVCMGTIIRYETSIKKNLIGTHSWAYNKILEAMIRKIPRKGEPKVRPEE